MSEPASGQRILARISTVAIEGNCRAIIDQLADGSELCAVVKADAYGHGAAEVARAALRGGATRFAVATAGEAEEILAVVPEAGDVPLIVLGAMSPDELARAAAIDAEVGVWTKGFLDACKAIGAERGKPLRVHVKHDTGMGRLGETDQAMVSELLSSAARDEDLELAGLWTHFATADEIGDPYLEEQMERFSDSVAIARSLQPGCLVHAANSGATLSEPGSHFDFVRCGIAIYGLSPYGDDPRALGLEPALSLVSRIGAIKELQAGDSVGYGRKWTADSPTKVAICPVGYGDGYRRAFGGLADVLVGGSRAPVIGAVSMDNIAIDLGPDSKVEVGDEVVLLGNQGDDEITAQELADHLGTINYEVTVGIGQRVPREVIQ
jgi:alanine racemase